MLLYVDDIILAGRSRKELLRIKEVFEKRFPISYLGEPQVLLGVRITRDRNAGTLKLDQKQYIEDMLERFNMGR